MTIERKSFGGAVVETKIIQVKGIDVGVIAGHIASWKPDSWAGVYGFKDRIEKGAYTKSLQELKARKNRQVRLKDHHGQTIGGFPIETVKQDNVGLYGVGHVNLETQQGREAHSLARQGVLVDFSVGHVVTEDRIEDSLRVISEATLLEGSIVDEPLNQRSNVTEVKSVDFGDLPIISRDLIPSDFAWDPEAARDRVLELKFADGNGAHAFVGEEIIADVINGKLMIIPEAVHAACEKFADTEEKTAKKVLERYLGKIGAPSPFEKKSFFTIDDVKSWGSAEVKSALMSTGSFSNGAVRALVASLATKPIVPDVEEKSLDDILSALQEAQKTLKGASNGTN